MVMAEVDKMVTEVQNNLKRVIKIADEISNEYRRLIHIDMTSDKKKGRNVKLLRELLSTDNHMRDTIAHLRKAMSTLSFNTDKHEILKNEEFIQELGQNLIQMYESFDAIVKVMDFESGQIDIMVMETIESLDHLSKI